MLKKKKDRDSQTEEPGNLVSRETWTTHYWLNGGVPKASQGVSEKTQASDMNRATMSSVQYILVS